MSPGRSGSRSERSQFAVVVEGQFPSVRIHSCPGPDLAIPIQGQGMVPPAAMDLMLQRILSGPVVTKSGPTCFSNRPCPVDQNRLCPGCNAPSSPGPIPRAKLNCWPAAMARIPVEMISRAGYSGPWSAVRCPVDPRVRSPTIHLAVLVQGQAVVETGGNGHDAG
jgi:hypothetical protein